MRHACELSKTRGPIAGIDVTIYNPQLDTADYAAGQVLRDVVVAILA